MAQMAGCNRACESALCHECVNPGNSSLLSYIAPVADELAVTSTTLFVRQLDSSFG